MFLDILRNINKKYLLIIAFILLTTISILFYFKYINSLQQLTIDYKNVSKVVIVEDFVANNSPENNRAIATINRSGETITLPRKNYFIKYTPMSGYSKKNINLSLLDEKKVLKIDPDFSDNKLEEIRKLEFNNIKNSILESYPYINNIYDIKPGKLYKKGDWYGTTIQYIGEDYVNSDTLRLVMQKNLHGFF